MPRNIPEPLAIVKQQLEEKKRYSTLALMPNVSQLVDRKLAAERVGVRHYEQLQRRLQRLVLWVVLEGQLTGPAGSDAKLCLKDVLDLKVSHKSYHWLLPSWPGHRADLLATVDNLRQRYGVLMEAQRKEPDYGRITRPIHCLGVQTRLRKIPKLIADAEVRNAGPSCPKKPHGGAHVLYVLRP
jgi:hypothetical protein